jgi:hypothetical protein
MRTGGLLIGARNVAVAEPIDQQGAGPLGDRYGESSQSVNPLPSRLAEGMSIKLPDWMVGRSEVPVHTCRAANDRDWSIEVTVHRRCSKHHQGEGK